MLSTVSKYRKPIALVLTYVYAAWLILQIFVAKFGLDALSKAAFLDSINAVAYRPFVYRTLVPAIVRSAVEMIPEGLARQMVEIFKQPEILPPHATNFTIQYVLFAVLTWACFVGFAFSMRWLVRHFYPAYSEAVTDYAVPLGALFLLPLFFRNFNFVYDPATILLFSLAMISMIQKRYLLYILVVALCALNKETSVLLIPMSLIYAREKGMKPLPLILLALLQLGICLGIYKYITHSMADRPGETMEIQLVKYNLRLPLRLPYAFIWLMGVFAGFTYFTGHHWKTKPTFLRHALVFMLIPHLALLIVVGCIDEIRIFYEVYAILVLLMTPSVIQMAQTLFL